jgi:hypothetical protein
MNNEETATLKKITHFCKIRISYKQMVNSNKDFMRENVELHVLNTLS